VGKEDVEALALFTVVSNNYARAADDLSGIAFSVDLAQTSPAKIVDSKVVRIGSVMLI
jgi:hypothetical protein